MANEWVLISAHTKFPIIQNYGKQLAWVNLWAWISWINNAKITHRAQTNPMKSDLMTEHAQEEAWRRSGTAENVACVAGGICARVLYILFSRPKSAVLILRRSRNKSVYNTTKKEGRAFPNIGNLKNIYIFPTVKSALLLLSYISSKYGAVKGRWREGVVFIKDWEMPLQFGQR